MRGMRYVACVGQEEKCIQNFWVKHEGKKPLGRSRNKQAIILKWI
jgi:hypothetical protein